MYSEEERRAAENKEYQAPIYNLCVMLILEGRSSCVNDQYRKRANSSTISNLTKPRALTISNQ
jgi:hypothetical protein